MAGVHLIYDGSFAGFLSLIYQIYDEGLEPISISRGSMVVDLFAQQVVAAPDLEKSERVMKGITKRSSSKISKFIYACFLSEQVGVEMHLLHLIRYLFAGLSNRFSDYSDDSILALHKIHKKVGREVHRMHAFVRFQETKEDLWVCEINPDFNVLPLIGKHFKDRYPAMDWMIIDTIRQSAIYYDGGKVDYFQFIDKVAEGENRLVKEHITKEEESYQSMWKQYFKSVNIEERRNDKLHVQHVPKRYWKYLIEKQ